MVKTLLAALLSAALIWAIPIQATPVNNSEIRNATLAKPAEQVLKSNHPAQDVKQVETPAQQQTETQPEQATVATPEPVVAETPQISVPTTHEALMAAAGISPADYGAVDYIVSHESSWNENATEPTTGAHGLPQALPYSKTNCGWSDAVCQLSWANTYAVSRYGGWWPAYDYWVAHRNW